MEANPVIYKTNYINDTSSAIQLIKEVHSEGFRLNLDVGTMIYNSETVDILENHIGCINHVHISEPFLKPIEERPLHKELALLLRKGHYDRFISIEMGKGEGIEAPQKAIEYVKEIFG